MGHPYNEKLVSMEVDNLLILAIALIDFENLM